MNDLLSKIKSLKLVKPEKAFVRFSKEKMLAELELQRSAFFSKMNFTLSLVMAALLIAVVTINFATKPRITALDQDELVKELQRIDLEAKITAMKNGDALNQNIDLALNNLNFANTGLDEQNLNKDIKTIENQLKSPNSNTIDNILNELF